jgi:hypothetical protein
MAEEHPKHPTEQKAHAKGRRDNEGKTSSRTERTKRPRDLNLWAKHTVDMATMDDADRQRLLAEKTAKKAERKVD